jgi:iron(II)-dependent oxidoreductase
MKKLVYFMIVLPILEIVSCNYDKTEDNTSNYPGEMITVSAGNFLMGSDNEKLNNSPRHSVYLPTYKIGKYEVTRGECRNFIKAGGYQNKKYWSEDGWKWKEEEKRTEPKFWAAEQDWGSGKFTQTEKYPAVGMSCYEAEAYCKWAGVRLPTEAEWEKAARWDDKKQHSNIYPWGDIYNQENEVYKSLTYPVGSCPQDKSSYGCMDMAGNVSEWCADWIKSYPGSTQPFDYTNSQHVLRGWAGHVGKGGGRYYRCANRSCGIMDLPSAIPSSGFRIARDGD